MEPRNNVNSPWQMFAGQEQPLGTDIVNNIFIKLDGNDLCQAFFVCKAWRAAVMKFCEAHNISKEILRDIKLASKEMEYKIVLVGDPAVGKTTLIRRLLTGRFHTDLPREREILDYDHNRFKTTKRMINCIYNFWDLTLHDGDLTNTFDFYKTIFRSADLIIFCVDYNKNNTSLPFDIDKAMKVSNGKIIVVKTKAELEDTEAKSKERIKHADHVYCISNKTGKGIKELLSCIYKLVYEKDAEKRMEERTEQTQALSQNKSKKQCRIS